MKYIMIMISLILIMQGCADSGVNETVLKDTPQESNIQDTSFVGNWITSNATETAIYTFNRDSTYVISRKSENSSRTSQGVYFAHNGDLNLIGFTGAEYTYELSGDSLTLSKDASSFTLTNIDSLAENSDIETILKTYNNPIIGTWESDDFGFYTFKDDNTFISSLTFAIITITSKGDFEVKNRTIEFTLTEMEGTPIPPGSEGSKSTVDYTITDDTLSIISEGIEQKFIKK